jgi:hypothetical protein
VLPAQTWGGLTLRVAYTVGSRSLRMSSQVVL